MIRAVALVSPWLSGLMAVCVAGLVVLQLLLSRRLTGAHAGLGRMAAGERQRENGSGARSMRLFLRRGAYRSFNDPTLNRMAFWVTWGVRLI